MEITAAELATTMPDASQLLSDEPEMESSLHYEQLALLVSCLAFLWRDRSDYFLGANLTVYYSRARLRDREFRGPDFFLVKDTEKRSRTSWVVWEEDGRYPNLIIELLSSSTAEVDRTEKKRLYQNRFRTPEYFWFSPSTLEFTGFRLEGSAYSEIAPNERDWLWSQELDLYLGIADGQLRYFHPNGMMVPTPEEDALVSEQRGLERGLKQGLAQGQQQKAREIAADLLASGMDIEQVTRLTGLDFLQGQQLEKTSPDGDS